MSGVKRTTNITFPFCGTTKELQKYMESFNRGIAVKCHYPVVGHDSIDFYGIVMAIAPGTQTGDLHERRITVRPCASPKPNYQTPFERAQAELEEAERQAFARLENCRCVPIIIDDPPYDLLEQSDRRYGRSPVESLLDGISKGTGIPMSILTGRPSDLVYHISEMTDLRLPTVGRRVKQAPLAHWETHDRYELGEMYFEGNIDFTVEMTGRNAYAPRIGALAEVHLDSSIWKGYVEGYTPTYFGIRPPQMRITLRPTGVPVFSTKPVTKESTMKVFEAIVVTVNEQNVITGIAKGVQLVVAADAQTAKDQVLVDYALEAKLTGKELTGYKVRTREFLG